MADARYIHNHNAHERVTPEALNRVSSLLLRMLGDGLFHRIFEKENAGGLLAPEDVGVFGEDLRVNYVSGSRDSGLVFQVAKGLGFKYLDDVGQPDANEPTLVPLILEADLTLPALAVSDPTNDRIDEVYVKRDIGASGLSPRDIVDPVDDSISSQSVPTRIFYDTVFAVAQGTPAATPVAPTVPATFDATDRIATITVRAGSGAFIENNDYIDRRIKMAPRGVGLGGRLADLLLNASFGGYAVWNWDDGTADLPGPGGFILQWGNTTAPVADGASANALLKRAPTTQIAVIGYIEGNPGLVSFDCGAEAAIGAQTTEVTLYNRSGGSAILRFVSIGFGDRA